MSERESMDLAMRRYAGRVRGLVHLYSELPDKTGEEADEYVGTIVFEAAMIAEQGPAAYLRFMSMLDEAEIGEEIDAILGQGEGAS